MWEDVKPGNILVSNYARDIKLIDIGGGYSISWVVEKLVEPVECDLENLQKILSRFDCLRDRICATLM